jgi:hypothetical protein
MNGFAKTFRGNIWKAIENILVGDDLDAIAQNRLPALDPAPAKTARSIEDQDGSSVSRLRQDGMFPPEGYSESNCRATHWGE